MKTWSDSIGLEPNGDLVWNGYDRGPHLKAFFGASEYEWWRTVPAAHLPALVAALGGAPGDDVIKLVRARFESDVDLAAFAEAHGVETTFSSFGTTDWS